ncbi:MAG: hypothetical protein JSW34_09615 [Candidatus Zixiibacteriota bacterium]|nr:MAG: hypothetical protein JSW34_09615 [candidate division Zixibacteria bacterium]
MKNRILSVFCCLLAITCSTTAAAQEPDTLAEVERRILQRALEYTGFDGLEGFSEEAVEGPRLVIDTVDNTAFLHRYFADQQVWKVTFKNVVITRDKLMIDSTHSHARDYSVFIEPMSERLLKVTSAVPSGKWPYPDPGTAEQRENAWKRLGITSLALPEAMPVPLAEVLRNCAPSPYLATELCALYITKSWGERTDTRWEVSLRGIPPMPAFGPGADHIPVEQLTTITVYFDPLSGEETGAMRPAR